MRYFCTVSAGFDAAEGDELGECKVTPAAYAHMTHQLMALAEGKVVVALEVRSKHSHSLAPTLKLKHVGHPHRAVII